MLKSENIELSGKNAVVVRVDIEQMTGKESLDLMNSRKK